MEKEQMTCTTIDEYIAQYPPEVQMPLNTLRSLIRETAPDATEKISWGMATFVLHGNLVHFAGAKKHMGFYPAPSAIVAFEKELAAYKCSKGTVQFPYTTPLPLDLIRRMVQFRITEQLALAENKKPKSVKSLSRQGMTVESVLQEIKALGTEQTKKVYRNHGAQEPLFGVATGAMKPLAKKIKRDYQLSMELYDTGNYDAMYFAGIIADPTRMCEKDFEKWMKTAYFYMVSDYIVAVTLAETNFAQTTADRWIDSGKELYMSAGWSCYSWLLGTLADDTFDQNKIDAMLDRVGKTIHSQPDRTKYAMNNFIISVGTSYLPLHEEAIKTARLVGKVSVNMGTTSCKTPLAEAYIEKAVAKGRLGFKRKNVRC